MVTVHAKADSIAAYQALLTSDWTKSLTQKVLALLWKILSTDASAETSLIWQLLNPSNAKGFSAEQFRAISSRIQDGTRFIRLANVPPVDIGRLGEKRNSLLLIQARQLAAYLTLQAHTQVLDRADFLLDVQALGFQAAIHFVLPELRERNEPEYSLLLNAAILFAVGNSANDFAHSSYMLAMIHGHLGDQEQRLRSLLASFRCTSPEDHSYLTKAQEVWTELLEQDKRAEAEDFLLDLNRSSLPSHQEEVREMVVDAFKFILRDSADNN